MCSLVLLISMYDCSSSFLNDLWVLTGDPADTTTLSCATGWISYLHIHGILMVVAFGILFPTGFFVARFFKCKGTGKASKVWFICHVIIQVSRVQTICHR